MKMRVRTINLAVAVGGRTATKANSHSIVEGVHADRAVTVLSGLNVGNFTST